MQNQPVILAIVGGGGVAPLLRTAKCGTAIADCGIPRKLEEFGGSSAPRQPSVKQLCNEGLEL